ncbi:hypothetical protein PQZ07_00025 [bacterium]|jgi:hypothetical protein|nr:hypothetical protein [bacterium]
MNNNLVRCENGTGLARDKRTGAIVNINTSEINAARERKKNRINKEMEFEQLKTDVSEMKQLLNTIIEKL